VRKSQVLQDRKRKNRSLNKCSFPHAFLIKSIPYILPWIFVFALNSYLAYYKGEIAAETEILRLRLRQEERRYLEKIAETEVTLVRLEDEREEEREEERRYCEGKREEERRYFEVERYEERRYLEEIIGLDMIETQEENELRLEWVRVATELRVRMIKNSKTVFLTIAIGKSGAYWANSKDVAPRTKAKGNTEDRLEPTKTMRIISGLTEPIKKIMKGESDDASLENSKDVAPPTKKVKGYVRNRQRQTEATNIINEVNSQYGLEKTKVFAPLGVASKKRVCDYMGYTLIVRDRPTAGREEEAAKQLKIRVDNNLPPPFTPRADDRTINAHPPSPSSKSSSQEKKKFHESGVSFTKLRKESRSMYAKESYAAAHARWEKVSLILECMEAMPEAEMFVWSDGDVVFNQNTTAMPEFVEDLGLTYDWNGADMKTRINTGVMFIKNTQWSYDFFRKVWDHRLKTGGDTGGEGDQKSINKIINESDQKKIKIVDRNIWNAFPRKRELFDDCKDGGRLTVDGDEIADTKFLHFAGAFGGSCGKLLNKYNTIMRGAQAARFSINDKKRNTHFPGNRKLSRWLRKVNHLQHSEELKVANLFDDWGRIWESDLMDLDRKNATSKSFY
jgi:hypothetical protein